MVGRWAEEELVAVDDAKECEEQGLPLEEKTS